ncbi:MAG: pyridoxal 5'-phosphate synthase glutaminase subunit PdxT [Candidatus Geothermincolia bacterium]
MKIGVLALQGAVREHLQMIESCGARGVAIKRPAGLNDVSGLIIPGGESTTIGKLIDEYGFAGPIKRLASDGMPLFGTCAGLIIVSQRVRGKHGTILGLADVTVERNAFGRQVDSFERDLLVSGIDDENLPFRAVFIRAPVIEETGPGVVAMAEVEEGVVLARDGNILLGAFHPELTGDTRVHRFFLEMVKASRGAGATEV